MLPASESRFDVVEVPALTKCNRARVAVVVHALGTPEGPAGVKVLLNGEATGIESFTTRWTPELSLVETLAVGDAAQLTAKAMGDAVVVSAVARPFYDPELSPVEDGRSAGAPSSAGTDSARIRPRR